MVGPDVGDLDGAALGLSDGDPVGAPEGESESAVGPTVGAVDGIEVTAVGVVDGVEVIAVGLSVVQSITKSNNPKLAGSPSISTV